MNFLPHNGRVAANQIDPLRTRLVQELRHNSPLLGCRFDPSGRYVFAGAQDNSIQRWDLTNARKATLTGHRSWIRALTFTANPARLISGAYDGQLIWWDTAAEAPAPLRTVQGHRGFARAAVVSPDGALLATCGNDNLVKLWNAADGTPVRALEGHACHVYNVAFHPDGQHLVSGDLRGAVKQWSVAQGTEVRALDASVLHRYDTTFRADIGGVRSMAFNRDGSLLACAGITDVTNAFAGVGRPVVVLFNWQTGQRTQLLRPAVNFQGTAWGVAFHPSGFVACAGGGSGGALWFWRPDQAASFHALTLPTNARDLDLSPDGRRLAIAFFDGAVRIYDLA
jgi:WD40 repeat protein